MGKQRRQSPHVDISFSLVRGVQRETKDTVLRAKKQRNRNPWGIDFGYRDNSRTEGSRRKRSNKMKPIRQLRNHQGYTRDLTRKELDRAKQRHRSSSEEREILEILSRENRCFINM